MVALGRQMNETYRTLMEEIFEQIEEWSKKLGRPIKDLDDIRTAMGALKELKNDEIKIDMALSPVEVGATYYQLSKCICNCYEVCIIPSFYAIFKSIIFHPYRNHTVC